MISEPFRPVEKIKQAVDGEDLVILA